MKNKFFLVALLFTTVATFAQKNETKAAEKALKAGNAQEALTVLKTAEGLLANATPADKAFYLYIKGNAALDLATKGTDTEKNLGDAAAAYNELIAVEKTAGKAKYTEEVSKSVEVVRGKYVSHAIALSEKEDNEGASRNLYASYELNKTDLEKLYFAASYAINAKKYDLALGYYNELKEKNYSGEATEYYAKNIISGQEDYFGNTEEAGKERDNRVKLKLYSDPREVKIPSRRGEIYKNISSIYVFNNKIPEAKKAVADARLANPDDVSLIITEANLYLQTNDFEAYKKLATEALEKNPNDADLVFNLGVISANAKNVADAEKYYTRTIEIDPKYINAYINLAALKLEGEKKIVDAMAKLGTSDKDMKSYAALKSKREVILKALIPLLKKGLEVDAKNADISKTLMGVYRALEMTAEYKALKAKM
jgi:tetratricopeptide (TPR) repeat protein